MKTTITDWAKKYGIAHLKGVVHVGAALGEEREEWEALTDNVLWCEANPALWGPLERNVLHLGHTVQHSAIGSFHGYVNLNISTAFMSSSVLQFKEHAQMYPHIIYSGAIQVPITTLDLLLKGKYDQYDMLCMDVQGYEGEVILGASKLLPHLKWIHSEYNEKEMYRDCILLPDLTLLLEQKGFRLMETFSIDNGWGDCLFMSETPW